MSTTVKKRGIVSTGICNFCQAEMDKAKMTQHLKHCKQRLARFSSGKQNARRQQGRLLHLLVEGKYSPQYWMHLEIPASESLLTLDGFLRDIWLECCGHLSSFTINGINYTMEPDDSFLFFLPGEDDKEIHEEEEVEEEQEYDDKQMIADALEYVHSYLKAIVPEYREYAPYDVLDECAQFSSVDDLILFIQEKDKAIKQGDPPRSSDKEGMKEYHKRFLQKDVFRILLRWLQQDRDMDVPMEKALKILKPGKNFFHEYDFGSTTYLSLRVIAEREGIFPTKKEGPVSILAQNCPPEYSCQICGQPAELISSEGYYDDSGLYCKKCAKKTVKYIEDMLPVVNSPRVGVCGYTG